MPAIISDKRKVSPLMIDFIEVTSRTDVYPARSEPSLPVTPSAPDRFRSACDGQRAHPAFDDQLGCTLARTRLARCRSKGWHNALPGIKTSRYARSTVEQEHNDTGRLQWCAGSCGRIGRGPLNKRPGRHLRDSLSYQLVRSIPKPPFDRTIRRDAFSLCLLRVACIPFTRQSPRAVA